MEYNTELKPDDFVLLKTDTRYGQNILARYGVYWQVSDVTLIEDTPSLVLHRCIIEEKIRGAKEELVIDKKIELQIAIDGDSNFMYEQVIYEEE